MIKKLKKGILIHNTIVVDGNKTKDSDIVFISHAHEDHLPTRKTSAWATNTTIKITNIRKKKELLSKKITLNHKNLLLKMLDAGHVPGAKMLYIENDQKILYTGDYSIHENPLTPKAKPKKADILIVDATYIDPDYVLPNRKDTIKRMIDYIYDYALAKNKNAHIYTYSFGKAQIISTYFEKYGIAYEVDASIWEINNLLEKEENIKFKNMAPLSNKTPKIRILPLHKRFESSKNTLKIGVSGWALNKHYAKKMKLDIAFPYSDHADYEEAIKFIKKVSPSVVLGFQVTNKEAFESSIIQELGIYAKSL